MLTNQQIIALKKFKYQGSDNSYLYRYVLSPWAEYCVYNFVPMNIAPNLITVSGLCLSIITTGIVCIFNPSLGDGPRWVSALVGLTIFAYQTLDNMDGKQARRTNSSSPLGYLVDHACDAINATLLVICVISCFGSGWNLKLYLGFVMAYVQFYGLTWDEYFSGALVLPIVNGPSDGLVCASILAFTMAVYGNKWFHQSTIDVTPFAPIIFNLCSTSSCQNFLNIAQNNSKIHISPMGLLAIAIIAQIIIQGLDIFQSGKSSVLNP